MIIAIDSETTGVDMRHGARPFFVTVCDERGDQLFWEWDVDPLTRQPVIPPGDLDEIRALINEADGLVLQNAKFDVTALTTIGIDDWPWHKTEDTLIASHVLASNQPHDLTSLAVRYLGWNIQPYEDALEEVVQHCRRHCRSHYKDWLIAKKDLKISGTSHQNHYVMPSAKDKCWKFDMWLPRTLVKHWWDTSMAGKSVASGQRIARTRLEVLQGWEFAPPEIRGDCPATSMTCWWTLLRDYSNADSAATAALWKELVRELKRRDLWEIYMAARRKPGIAYRMESRGVTVSQKRLHELTSQYREESASCSRVCESIAQMYDQPCPDCAVNDNLIFGQYASADCTRCGGSGKVPYELELPRGGVNNSLKKFVFDILQLPPIYNKRAKSSNPTLGKEAIVQYLNFLSPTSLEHKFIQKLGEKRQRDTAISYMASYQRFWLPLTEDHYATTQSSQEDLSEQSTEDRRVLGMDGIKVRQRIRTVQDGGGDKGPPDKLPSVRGPYPARSEGPSQVRQPGVRQTGSSVSRDEPGQLGRHGTQGTAGSRSPERLSTPSGEIAARAGTSSSQIERRSGQAHTSDLCEGQQALRRSSSGKEVRCDEGNPNQGGRRDFLEARYVDGWYILHPHLNVTGTDTLRWSSSMPNEQNISKKEGFNLRYCFGPAPGREWWSLDAKNIELRIPAYASGEQDFIDLFERPDDPPYFGSNHLLIAHLLYPKEFETCINPGEPGINGGEPFIDGRIFKKRYESSIYRSIKFGNFALLYGAVDRPDGLGTADRNYGVKGAHSKIKHRFAKQEAYNQRWIQFAKIHGYVETLPDRTVNPKKGYPILCTRTEFGEIKPTVPLNFHVQSSAMWWTQQAMYKSDVQLEEWRADGFDGYLVMQIHDELVFDFPRAADPKVDPDRSNLGRARIIQRLMESCGDDIGIPIAVGLEYHTESWAEGVSF